VRLTSRSTAALAATAVLALALAACSKVSNDSAAGGGGGGANPNPNAPSWCGSKKITLALADGFGGNAWRQVTSAEAKDEASKCPSVTEYLYSDGQGNTQKAISDIQGFVAKGVNALVVFPDAGKAMLPAIRSAFKAGVVTVPYRVSPGGEAGQDYDFFIDTDFKQAGELWATWLVKALNGKGNVINLGGPPANSQSLDEYTGMQNVLKDHPDIKFIGQTPYHVTNWDPAETQKVVTAVLAKYPQIDAITTDYGNALASSFPAFQQASRKLPAIATEDANLLGCDWKKAKDGGTGFELFTVSSQNWMSRLAVQFAVAKATGGKVPDSRTAPQEAFEDSIGGTPNPVKCDPALPGDAFLSSKLTPQQQLTALGK
jgi:ribose transport system substrate-binding protein